MTVTTTTATTILSLPAELVEDITTWLSIKDCCSLRLASRRINNAFVRLFARKYLSTVHVNFSREGLDKLARAADGHVFREAVSTLCVCGLDEEQSSMGNGFAWDRDSAEWGALYTSEMKSIGSIGGLDHHHPSIDIVKDLLVNKLPNCRRFRVEKLRGPPMAWRPTDAVNDRLYIRDVTRLLLTAFVRGSIKVRAFEVDSSYPWVGDNSHLYYHETVSGRHREESDKVTEKCFGALKDVRLNCYADKSEIDMFEHLVYSAKRLEAITLRTYDWDGSEGFKYILTRLASRQGFVGLRCLKLEYVMVISQQSFSDMLLQAAGTLEDLSLVGTCLSPGHWLDIFSLLGEEAGRLKKIIISGLSECRNWPDRRRWLGCEDLMEKPKVNLGTDPLFGVDGRNLFTTRIIGPRGNALRFDFSYFEHVGSRGDRECPFRMGYSGANMAEALEYLSLKRHLKKVYLGGDDSSSEDE